jgi:hypothetical protein
MPSWGTKRLLRLMPGEYNAEAFDQLTVDVTFSGDYDDLLWIEI